MLSYPYRSAAFPGAHEALRHAGTFGPTAILSDGDPVYQPAKIARAGFADEVALGREPPLALAQVVLLVGEHKDPPGAGAWQK